MNRTQILLILLLCFILIFIKIRPFEQDKEIIEAQKPVVSDKIFEEIDKNLANISTVKELQINPTESYNYLNKSDIYAIRKKYVKKSLFYTLNYKPSDIVFGQIEDKKPWYGLKYYNCAGNTKGKDEVVMGDSEESRFINNPDLLIGISSWVHTVEGKYKNNPLCTDLRYTKMLKALTYRPETKTITAVYDRPSGTMFNLVGINARDFGYEYIYAKNVENVNFTEGFNITGNVYKLQDYIHAGCGCGLQGCCNNASPEQSYLVFQVDDNTKAKINLKLWHNRPKTKFDEADINFNIVIYTH